MSSTLDSRIKKIEARVRADDPDALAQASKLVEQYPNEVKTWSLRAYVQGRAGNWVESIEDLSHAIDITPSESSLFFDRGRYYAKLGDYQRAIDDFSRGLAACDQHSNDYYRESLHFLRADAYLKLGNKAEALEDLKGVREDFSLWTNELCTKQGLLAQCSASK